ncbi:MULTISPECIES: winged-helix domain-containing protein [Sporosarcina]|uniref:Winged-helix domain-containing protein n=1 Tax=Sporosarcina contaminans TaxID=633403 RepID=A0ABW3TYR8_9BACL
MWAIETEKLLEEREIILSEQQIRLRLEVLQELGLVNARQGRGGTTITNLGEKYLQSKEFVN